MAEQKVPAARRHELILRAIQSEGFVRVPEMAKSFRVSEMTLRRDLDQLAEQKQLTRTHGGARPTEHPAGLEIDLVEPSVDERATRNHGAKLAIAKRAQQMLQAGQTIALDVGTTTFELAKLMRAMSGLSAFTNSLKIAKLLSQTQPATYVPGGQVHGTEPSIVGARAIKQLDDFYFDIAFLGVSGLSLEGFFDYSLEDSEIKRALIARSKTSVALVDSSKFERMSVALVARLEDVDVLVAERQPPESLDQALKAAGVRVEIAAALSQ